MRARFRDLYSWHRTRFAPNRCTASITSMPALRSWKFAKEIPPNGLPQGQNHARKKGRSIANQCRADNVHAPFLYAGFRRSAMPIGPYCPPCLLRLGTDRMCWSSDGASGEPFFGIQTRRAAQVGHRNPRAPLRQTRRGRCAARGRQPKYPPTSRSHGWPRPPRWIEGPQ